MDIENAVEGAIMAMVFVNSYFDSNDYSNPIKDYLDDRIYNKITYQYTKEIFAYIRQSSLELQDNILQYSPDGNQSSFNCKNFDDNLLNMNLFFILVFSLKLFKIYKAIIVSYSNTIFSNFVFFKILSVELNLAIDKISEIFSLKNDDQLMMIS